MSIEYIFGWSQLTISRASSSPSSQLENKKWLRKRLMLMMYFGTNLKIHIWVQGIHKSEFPCCFDMKEMFSRRMFSVHVINLIILLFSLEYKANYFFERMEGIYFFVTLHLRPFFILILHHLKTIQVIHLIICLWQQTKLPNLDSRLSLEAFPLIDHQFMHMWNGIVMSPF